MQLIFIDKISRFCLVVFSLVMAFATFACFYFSLSKLNGIGFAGPVSIAIAGILAVTVLTVVAAFRNRVTAIFQEIAHVPHLFVGALVLGVAIRIAWWWLTLPEVQVGDGAAYLALANKLYEGRDYVLDTGYAYWPPGTPLIYAAFLFILGQHGWLALVVNLVAFVLCGISVRAIFVRLGMPPSFAGLSVALLAIWPELFFTAGQVSKETLLLSLLSGGFALLLSGSGWSWLASGLLSGLAVLTQPGLLFLPVLFGFGLVGMGYPSRRILLCLFAVLIGMAVVVAPWTYRNYRIFGEPIISTNFGITLHAANQLALVRSTTDVGEWLMPPVPEQPFSDDLAASRWHTAEALKFIKEYPGDFLVLVTERLTMLMGDDSDSVFRSLRSTQKASGNAYLAAKALCNGFWLILTALLSVFCWNFRDRESLHRAAPVIFVATLATLYAMGVYGISEGGAHHHMDWSWIYSVMLALALWSSTQSATDRIPTLAKMRFGPSENWLRG